LDACHPQWQDQGPPAVLRRPLPRRYHSPLHHSSCAPTPNPTPSGYATVSRINGAIKPIASFNLRYSFRARSDPATMTAKLITFYEVNPVNRQLSVHEDIQPMAITMESVRSLRHTDYGQIPIDYGNLRPELVNGIDLRNPRSLSEQLPPSKCRQWDRIDPLAFCEIFEICHALRLNQPSGNKQQSRVVTFRHNLRALANMALYQLSNLRIYDHCGINIGVHRVGTDIVLENVLEKKERRWSVDMVYGHLLEHCLQRAGGDEAMDYGKVLDRTEIRSLNEMRFGDDVECLCAAEMDAVLCNDTGKMKVVEVKSTKTKGMTRSKMKGILDWKLLKYWTQCKFGGVDAVLIAFHKNGVIERTELVDTAKLEQMFPVITSKCIGMMHSVLKWIQSTMLRMPERTMYQLSFAKLMNGTKNEQIVLQHLQSDNITKERIKKFISTEAQSKVRLNCGLVIDPHSGQIELERLLH